MVWAPATNGRVAGVKPGGRTPHTGGQLYAGAITGGWYAVGQTVAGTMPGGALG